MAFSFSKSHSVARLSDAASFSFTSWTCRHPCKTVSLATRNGTDGDSQPIIKIVRNCLWPRNNTDNGEGGNRPTGIGQGPHHKMVDQETRYGHWSPGDSQYGNAKQTTGRDRALQIGDSAAAHGYNRARSKHGITAELATSHIPVPSSVLTPPAAKRTSLDAVFRLRTAGRTTNSADHWWRNVVITPRCCPGCSCSSCCSGR